MMTAPHAQRPGGRHDQRPHALSVTAARMTATRPAQRPGGPHHQPPHTPGVTAGRMTNDPIRPASRTAT
jgi:hypothetical protein